MQVQVQEIAGLQQQLQASEEEKQKVQELLMRNAVLHYCSTLNFTGRDNQKTAAVKIGQGQGTSSGTAATEAAGKLNLMLHVIV